MTDYKNELRDILFRLRHGLNVEIQADVDAAQQAIEALLSERELEAYKKGYIDGGIHTLTNREEK